MKTLLLAMAYLAATTAGAYAANDGSVGTTSSGDLNITLTIAEQIVVTNLDDVNLGDGSSAAHESICVAGNIASDYDIRFTATEGAFNLTHETLADTIAYSIGYDHGPVGVFQPVSYNVTLVNVGPVYSADLNCNLGALNNGSISITANAADVADATAGAYTGTLEIEVAATL